MKPYPSPGSNLLARSLRCPTPIHVVLMGPPGSGKTSVGRLVAERLKLPFLDVDNDWLEMRWGTSVADKLKQVGDERFLDEEDEQLSHLASAPFLYKPHVVSLTGSNPLRCEGLKNLSRTSLIVYLDCAVATIQQRLERMKVDRIVGMATSTLAQVLARRYQVYDNSYDVRVPVLDGETPEAVADKLVAMLSSRGTHFESTRMSKASPVVEFDFRKVLMKGLAPDGGLYVPESLVRFTGDSRSPAHGADELETLVHLPYAELVKRVMEKFSPFFAPWEMGQMATDAFSSFSHPDVLPLTRHGNDLFTLEMWHGPTASFKDLSLQLLPKMFRRLINESRTPSTKRGLLVATSGDTGSAALDGFGRDPMLPVVVLYPENGVSPVQKLQMTKAPENVCVVGVETDFDWCQSLVKKYLNAPNPAVAWTSANSINLGRLLPQVVYAVAAYTGLRRMGAIEAGGQFDLTVPTGNFGNIFAAAIARDLGVPLRQLVCASNDNNVLTDFLSTGVYDLRRRDFHLTISPSIDILVSSNLERWLYFLYRRDGDAIAKLMDQLKTERFFKVSDEVRELIAISMRGGHCTEQQCLETIKSTFDKYGVLLDPHTAVAKFVADKYAQPHVPMVVCSTAHFGKFPAAMELALDGKLSGEPVERQWQRLGRLNAIPPALTSLLDKRTNHSLVVPADEAAVEAVISRYLARYHQ